MELPGEKLAFPTYLQFYFSKKSSAVLSYYKTSLERPI